MIRFSTLRHALLSLVLLAGAALSLLPGSAVAIAVVQSASANKSGASSATLSVSFASPPTPGNAIIVIWSSRELASLTSVADNQAGNTYSSVVIETSSANGVDSEIWWEPAVVGSSGTFTVTGTTAGTTDQFALTIVEVSGLTGVVDKTEAQGAENSSETLTITAPAANASANDLVIANMATGFTDTAIGISSPANAGYTSLNLQNGTGAYNGVVQTSFKIVTAIETSSANWTSTTAFNGAAGTLATFKGAAAPTAPSKFPFFGVGD